MNFMRRILLATGVTVIVGCAIGGYRDHSFPLATGHTKEEISDGSITLHYDDASLTVSMPDSKGKDESLVVAFVPIPLDSPAPPREPAKRTFRTSFWVTVQPRTSGIAFEPMKTVLRINNNKAIYPVGYLKDYSHIYYEGLELTGNVKNDTDPIPCLSKSQFNIMFDVMYDPNANYELSVDGLAANGRHMKIHEIKFVKKRIHYTK